MDRKTAVELFNTQSNVAIPASEDHSAVNLLRTRIKENKPEAFARLREIFDDQFIHQFFLANARDANKTYEYLESYIYYRITSYPGVLEKFPSVQLKMLETNNVALLKYRDDEDAMVILTRAKFWNPAENPVDDFITQGTLLVELGFRIDEKLSETGAVIILDCAELSFWQASYLTPMAVIKGFNLIVSSLPVFPKAIHVVNGGMLCNMLYNALYPVAKQWIGDKVHIHYGDLSTLHVKVPKAILPVSLGGELEEHDAFEQDICKMMQSLIASGYGGYASVQKTLSS
ncbi:alpha-tocopherol transfer protein-like isoform X2 [Folsomia candida]|uniref:Alpha-tocopherol transfer protein-like n=1 Tax=Folsomia candida TaxID=158441 RepID=A0A226F154_FOLCA|nr:alpha-tocopherol transfer protein-like isoform X2 [Folsomia candida]OXA63499.1 Alpha-tocopherol transfer protein-like [Folsomia candida]